MKKFSTGQICNLNYQDWPYAVATHHHVITPKIFSIRIILIFTETQVEKGG